MLQSFLKFDQYLTPAIIRYFYFLLLVLIFLGGIGGLFADLALMFSSPIGGIIAIIVTLVSTLVGIVAARISIEIIMVLFQNNEHLAVLRSRAEGH
jgi:hypothetical protein